MGKGCLAVLFPWLGRSKEKALGIGDKPTSQIGMSQGDMHSGAGGYEGGSYSGGYLANNDGDSSH